jgi:hypothetical protein
MSEFMSRRNYVNPKKNMCATKFRTIRTEKNSMWKVIRKCILRKETTQPVYYKETQKTLVDEFNIFFTTVGARASEKSRLLATRYDLPILSLQTLPVVIPDADKFNFRPVSCTERDTQNSSFISI